MTATGSPERVPLQVRIGFGLGTAGKETCTLGLAAFVVLSYSQAMGLCGKCDQAIGAAFGGPIAVTISALMRTTKGTHQATRTALAARKAATQPNENPPRRRPNLLVLADHTGRGIVI